MDTDRLIQALKELQTIKVGMTRADLLKVCTTEGGIFSRTQQSFVYRSCPIIKVAVTFKPIGGPPDQRQTQPSDEITDISKPYLELPVRD